jgi:exodeoxyribonuclease (lambda-induced)
MSNIEQRSSEWFEQRIGRFTASEIYKLMGVKGLGETGKTYILEKAIEQLYGKEEDDFVSYDMQRGIELEPLAFAKFYELMQLKFVDVENCGFFVFGKSAGASPDGLVGDDAILEIKCPKKETFFKLVATNKIDQKYYFQMQKQMLATKRKKAYFFNYLIIDGVEYHHTIEVERDDVVIDKMKERIKEAELEKNKIIELINNNKQY